MLFGQPNTIPQLEPHNIERANNTGESQQHRREPTTPARANNTGESQPQAPGQIGEHAPPPPPPPPPVILDSHADGHTKVYFLIAINEGIASE